MRKFFTLTLVFLAMMFGANAQYLLQEGFETGTLPTGWTTIDNDGDTYNWDPAYLYGQTGYAHTGDGMISSASYASAALTPDNWLITPAVTLSANATLTFWVCAQDASWAGEHYGVYISTTGTAISNFTLLFEETMDANGGARTQGAWKQKTVNLASYTGQTIYIAFRHFNCTDMFHLNLDDVAIFAQPTTPTVIAGNHSVDFGTTAIGNNKDATVDITTYNLTAAVTATTAAPFSVSADGTTYGATASVASTGGTLYLRYSPTAAGNHTGNVVLTSTGANNDTIAMTGSAIECSTTLPYSYNFDNEGANLCWEIIDANNDGSTFAFSPDDSLAYYTYNSSNDADDWLISPVFTLTGAQFGYFDYAAYSASYPERFQVFAIDANNNQTALTNAVEVTSTAFQTQVLDLTSLTGNYRIGIHCISDADEWRLMITNFNVNNNIPTTSVTVSESALDFSTIAMGTTSNPQAVILSTVNVNEAFTVTVTAPYEVSLDGTNYAATQTIPANAAMTTNDSIFVRFAPTTVGTFNQNMTINSTNHNETVALTGASADCSNGITTFPFLYDFNTGIYPPICWGYNDADNYGQATVDEDAGDYALVISDIDMLTTPEITSTNPMVLMFDYRTYLGDNYDDQPTAFRVGYSTTNNNASSFTWQTVTVTAYPDGDAIFDNYTAELPANTKYVAIDVTTFATYLYYGIFELSDVLYIDNFRLLTDATLMVSTENMDFGSMIMGSDPIVKTANVTGALLTNNITVNAPANFEVSANGSSYAATASLPQAGGTLYVRYNPTATGNHSGNVTLTSGSASKTIAVFGSAIDCSAPQALPFFEGFENETPECWAILDADGDGYSWEDAGMEAYEGDGCFSSASYINDVGALQPDNWLITPALSIPANGAKLSFYVVAQDASWANEHYGVYVSTTGINPSNFTLLYEEDLDENGGSRDQGTWKQKNVNLPYGGQTIHLAIRHFNCTDNFWMNIDNFSVTPGVGVDNHGLNTKVYPNPANNVLNINANCNINNVEVYNMMGQLVGSYDANDVNTQINTTRFANGVYTVKISTENGTSTQKFTVAR